MPSQPLSPEDYYDIYIPTLSLTTRVIVKARGQLPQRLTYDPRWRSASNGYRLWGTLDYSTTTNHGLQQQVLTHPSIDELDAVGYRDVPTGSSSTPP